MEEMSQQGLLFWKGRLSDTRGPNIQSHWNPSKSYHSCLLSNFHMRAGETVKSNGV